MLAWDADDGKTKGEFSAIFYKKKEFELLRDSTFWLSTTPDVAGSRSWDAALTRICTWANFRSKKSGKEFYLFNTHFDHRGDIARINSAELLRSMAQIYPKGKPAIIMGDFNSEPSETPYKVMTDMRFGYIDDTFYASEKNNVNDSCTFTGFEVNGEICKRIDYIFIDKSFKAKTYSIIHDNNGTYYPSDHLPVMSDVELLK